MARKTRGTPESRMRGRVKYRAKKLGIPYSLKHGDVAIPDVCPVLGIKLVVNRGGRKGYHPDSPSLDRIVPELGYVPGNVRVISARANLLKNDATVSELEAVLTDLRRLRS